MVESGDGLRSSSLTLELPQPLADNVSFQAPQGPSEYALDGTADLRGSWLPADISDSSPRRRCKISKHNIVGWTFISFLVVLIFIVVVVLLRTNVGSQAGRNGGTARALR